MSSSESATHLALSRMQILFTQAHEQFKTRPDRSNRYVELARKLQTRYRVKWPIELKTRFCSNCKHYLELGINAQKRVKKDHQSIHCLDCNHVHVYRLVEQTPRSK